MRKICAYLSVLCCFLTHWSLCMDIFMNIQFINGLYSAFTEINICLLLIVRQSTGKLDLTWPPPQSDEDQRQLSEVDFLFESLLYSFLELNVYVSVTLVLVALWLNPKVWGSNSECGNPWNEVLLKQWTDTKALQPFNR